MPLMRDDKKQVAALIIRRIKGGDSSDAMRESNERMSQVATEDGAELDTSPGMMAAAEEALEAIKSDNPAQFMSAVSALVEMAMMGSEEEEV